jgi:hypothetical protein
MKVRKMLVGVLLTGVFLTCFTLGSAYAGDTPGAVPNLSMWIDTWFKVKMTGTVYAFSNIGVKPKPSYTVTEVTGTLYMNITDWDTTTTPATPFLVVDVYHRESGSYEYFGTVNLYYFAGNDLKFVATGRVDNPTDASLSLLFVFTGKRNPANTAFVMDGSTKLSTMGSYVVEVDDAPGSTERWAGAAKLSGPMVPSSKLPPELR